MVIQCFSMFSWIFLTNNFQFLLYIVSRNSKFLKTWRPKGNAHQQLTEISVISLWKKDISLSKSTLVEKNATLTNLLQKLLQDLAKECINIDKLLQGLARYVWILQNFCKSDVFFCKIFAKVVFSLDKSLSQWFCYRTKRIRFLRF